MNIANTSTGFIDVPGQISFNIHAQGCKLRCPNCQNAELQPFEGGIVIAPSKLLEIIQLRPMCKWICWMGGDATYQPIEFKQTNNILKEKGYKIALYTGQYFKEVSDLLDDVDLVIDGPYEEEHGGVDKETTRQKCYLRVDNVFRILAFADLEQKINDNKGE